MTYNAPFQSSDLRPPPPPAPSLGVRCWRRLKAVPLAVLAVVLIGVTVGALAVAAQVIRPESTDVVATTIDERVAAATSRPLPGSVDNSTFPGPTPASAGDRSEVATVGGSVTLSGRVEDDGRPLDGARVQLTRWIGERSASLVLDTNADGAFVGEGLVGGLWTITAWKEPQYRKSDPQRVFMSDGQSATLTIRPPVVDAVLLDAEVATPTTDDQLTVVVAVETQVANAAGDVVAVGATGTGTIAYPAGHRGPAGFDVVDGVGEFVVQCEPPAAAGRVTIVFDGNDVQVEVPGCQRRAPTTTTPVPTTRPPSPTTTTAPGPPTTQAPGR